MLQAQLDLDALAFVWRTRALNRGQRFAFGHFARPVCYPSWEQS
jgi:hypothetical protein